MQQRKRSHGNHHVAHAGFGAQRHHDAGNKRNYLAQKAEAEYQDQSYSGHSSDSQNSEKDYIEGLSLGADAYIAKPFNLEILITTIENLIRNREVLRNNFSGKQEQDGQIEIIQPQSADEKLMKKVMKAINKNLNNPDLNAEMIAAEVGISRVHLYRKLKEITNQSTRDFIRNIRLKQAEILLKSEKNYSISEISQLVGFNNTTYFSNAFKELYGVSPSKYMEHCKENKDKLEEDTRNEQDKTEKQ